MGERIPKREYIRTISKTKLVKCSLAFSTWEGGGKKENHRDIGRRPWFQEQLRSGSQRELPAKNAERRGTTIPVSRVTRQVDWDDRQRKGGIPSLGILHDSQSIAETE